MSDFIKKILKKDQNANKDNWSIFDYWVVEWCRQGNWILNDIDQDYRPEGIEKLYNKLTKDQQGSMTPEESVYYIPYKMIFKSYIDAKEKIKKNKKWNYLLKIGFILVLCVVLIVQIVLFNKFWHELPTVKDSTSLFVQMEGALLIILALSSLIISKILDVKKYQETWARHQRYQFLREQEMLRFVLHEENYSANRGEGNLKRFVKNIWQIEKMNINKFCDNMENKEKGMIDEMTGIIKFVKPGGSSDEDK